jgi:hypothetical protein
VPAKDKAAKINFNNGFTGKPGILDGIAHHARIMMCDKGISGKTAKKLLHSKID